MAVAPATGDDGAAVDHAIDAAPATEAGRASVANSAAAPPAIAIFLCVLRAMVGPVLSSQYLVTIVWIIITSNIFRVPVDLRRRPSAMEAAESLDSRRFGARWCGWMRGPELCLESPGDQ